MQEDPGGNEFAAKVWAYHIGTGALTATLTHDPALFGNKLPSTAPTLPISGFTNDGERAALTLANSAKGIHAFGLYREDVAFLGLVTPQLHGRQARVVTRNRA